MVKGLGGSRYDGLLAASELGPAYVGIRGQNFEDGRKWKRKRTWMSNIQPVEGEPDAGITRMPVLCCLLGRSTIEWKDGIRDRTYFVACPASRMGWAWLRDTMSTRRAPLLCGESPEEGMSKGEGKTVERAWVKSWSFRTAYK